MPVPTINDTIYDTLLRSTFDVFLERDGEVITTPLKCRNLPFTTLMSILGEVAVSAKAELQDARRRVLTDIIATGAMNIPMDQLTDIVMPLLSNVLFDSPRLTQRVMMDVCVGMTDDKVVLFSVDDVLAILEAVISRLDVVRVADKARSIFTQATAIMGKALEVQGKKDRSLEQAQKSPSPKE